MLTNSQRRKVCGLYGRAMVNHIKLPNLPIMQFFAFCLHKFIPSEAAMPLQVRTTLKTIYALHTAMLLLVAALVGYVGSASAKTAPAIALYYGHEAPLEDLKVFDIVVVEPDHGYNPLAQRNKGAELFAYTSVAEVQPIRSYFQKIPSSWHMARNGHWNSIVLDQTPPQWPAFFADEVVGPLWQRGYRGFFLDTMDSYRLATRFNEAEQQAGLVRLIDTLHERFPGIRLIMNRGFDIVPRVKGKVEMVAAESLYRRWNAETKTYEAVPEVDRQWLMDRLRSIQRQDGMPITVIDYVDPADRALTRQTAQKIQDDGFTPWVTDGLLTSVGVGSIELMPRRVMVAYNSAEAPATNYTSAHRFLQMPLNHMGYVVDYIDVQKPLPANIFRDRYAGIVTAFDGYVPSTRRREFSQWLQALKRQGMPLALVGDLGLAPDQSWADTFGLQANRLNASPPIRALQPHPMIGFETPPPPAERDYAPIRLIGPQAAQATPLVELKDQKGQIFVAAALMPWGGFCLDPYVYSELPGTEQTRWVVDPFAFLQQALRLPRLPVPDITTESGRRLLMVHIDGDGFPSRAEMPGRPLAAQVLLKEVLEKYRIPQTVSVIEGEIAPHGLHPDLSGELEALAKRMFKLPHVEIASHSFSHPFLWDTDVKHGVFSNNNEVEYHLNIPNYQVDLNRETAGSADYIRKNLAPAGKPVRVFQWTGDTAPNEAALKAAYDAGMLNINGGDTFISRSNPSLTAVRPHGITKGKYLQVYAPIANENIFTNLWQGPYYGYERVLETFELTDKPRRIKPVSIYYHTYSTSKVAGLQALRKVYNWALNQPLHPVFTSEFIQKVHDFHTLAIATEGSGWRVRGSGELRTLRMPFPEATMLASLVHSQGVAGVSSGTEGAYIHLSGAKAWIANPAAANAPDRTSASPRVWLHDANARVNHWTPSEKGTTTAFRLDGHVPLHFALSGISPSCKVSANGRALTADTNTENPRTDLRTYRLTDASAQIQINCADR